jgi:hypothetical protein
MHFRLPSIICIHLSYIQNMDHRLKSNLPWYLIKVNLRLILFLFHYFTPFLPLMALIMTEELEELLGR